MRFFLGLVVLATLVWLVPARDGKTCHYNVNLSPRLVCTEPGR
jgi:hypothetical protein